MMKSALLENVSSELVKRLFNHGKLIKKSMPSLMNELRDHKKVNVETTIKDPNKQLLGYLKKKYTSCPGVVVDKYSLKYFKFKTKKSYSSCTPCHPTLPKWLTD